MARTGRPRIPGPISYSTAHGRVVSARGRASAYRCEDCGGPAREWSYRGGSANEYSEQKVYPSGNTSQVQFSSEPEDYDPRCARCHRVYDRDQLTQRLELSYG